MFKIKLSRNKCVDKCKSMGSTFPCNLLERQNDLLYINIKKNNQGRQIIDIFPVVTMKVVEDSNKWSSLKVLLGQCMATK